MKFIFLMIIKVPTIFISKINFMLSWVEHENSFMTLGQFFAYHRFFCIWKKNTALCTFKRNRHAIFCAIFTKEHNLQLPVCYAGHWWVPLKKGSILKQILSFKTRPLIEKGDKNIFASVISILKFIGYSVSYSFS